MRIRVNAHSGLKQKEILTCYTWMNFEDIMLLNEFKQDKYHIISLIINYIE